MPRCLHLAAPLVLALAAAGALSGCAPVPVRSARLARDRAQPAAPPIHLVHGSVDELATARQVVTLFDRYDLGPWMLAPAIAIDRDAIPHSHPVLTLDTRHLRDDWLLLANLIHEETHWMLAERGEEVDAAIDDLEALFPRLPVRQPEGADGWSSSYEHLIVIWHELRGLRMLLGNLAARQVMEFWAHDHYRALYRTVLDHEDAIADVVRRHGLDLLVRPS